MESEHGEAGQVGGPGKEVEVGVDFGRSPDPGPSPPVFASHQVTEFSLDFRSGAPVVLDPPRGGLAGSGPGEDCFVAVLVYRVEGRSGGLVGP